MTTVWGVLKVAWWCAVGCAVFVLWQFLWPAVKTTRQYRRAKREESQARPHIALMLALIMLAGVARAGEVKLVWDYGNTNYIGGFRAHWGEESRTYTGQQDAPGPATREATIDLAATKTLYFAVTAYNVIGKESDYSTELIWDNEAPVLAWVPVIPELVFQDGAPLVMPDFTAYISVSDDVTPAPELVIVQTPSAGATLTQGATMITVTATDVAGNVARITREQVVTVNVVLVPSNVRGTGDGKPLQVKE